MSQEFYKAYILHVRKYTDSRVLVDFFTSSHGRISGVFRASKRNLSCIQPFQPLLISWRGSGDLKTILSSEFDTQAVNTLTEKRLFCGFYLNEILQRILPIEDSCSELFMAYERSIFLLSQAKSHQGVEPILRQFELFLLREMGFALNFNLCAVSGQVFVEGESCQYVDGEGFVKLSVRAASGGALVIDGGDLIAISKQNYSNRSTLRAAKQITRRALKTLLGHKPLKSREMFL